ncbi:cytochrome c, partial [Oceanospirillum sp. HFRX-1_2]
MLHLIKKITRVSFIRILMILSLGLLAACSDNDESNDGKMADHSAMNSGSMVKVERWYTQEMVNQGKPLYQENCAQCHGGFGQGNPDWRKPTEDGHYLPPPLNGTGHAWHHPLD